MTTSFFEEPILNSPYEEPTRHHALDEKGQPLFARLKQHRADQLAERWSRFSWYGINPVNKSGGLRQEKLAAQVGIGDVLNHLEAILITAAEPRHNRQGGRFGDNVEQYFQYRDPERLGLTTEAMIGEIYEHIRLKK